MTILISPSLLPMAKHGGGLHPISANVDKAVLDSSLSVCLAQIASKDITAAAVGICS